MLDVAARKGSACNTDHHLRCMKLRLKRTPGGRANRGAKCWRFKVEKLRVRCASVEEAGEGDEEENVKSKYLQGVLEELRMTGAMKQVWKSSCQQ